MTAQALQQDSAAQATGSPLLAGLSASARRETTPCGDGAMLWHIWGEGAPVVLLHGGAGSWRHWARNITDLARHNTVYAADLPGLGESAMPPEPYGPESVGAIVVAGMAEVLPPGQSCDLIGFSFGALIAGHAAAAAPARIRSLTLLGAGALGTPRGAIRLEKVRDKTGAARQAANRTNLERLMIADPARVDALALEIQDWNSRHARLASVPFATTTLLSAALQRVPAPLTAIWGERDAPAMPDLSVRIAALRQARPDAAVHVIPAAGHWVAYEAPEAVLALLTDVLTGGDAA